MDTNRNSILKSRLRLSKSAFLQLLNRILLSFKNYSFNVNGYNIHIQQIESEACTFQSDGVHQSFAIHAQVIKSSGWMPLTYTVPMALDCRWSIASKLGYPRIAISEFVVSIDSASYVKLFKRTIQVPDFIERIISKELASKQSDVEILLNNQIRKQINSMVSNSYSLQLPTTTHIFDPVEWVRLVRWKLDFDQEGITIDLLLAGYMADFKNADKPFSFRIINSPVDLDDTRSIFRLTIPLDYIVTLAKGKQIPLGKDKSVIIDQLQLESLSENRVKVKANLTSAIKGEIDLELLIGDPKKKCIEITSTTTELENPFLELGAKIFESKVANLIENNVNKLVEMSIDRIIGSINTQIRANSSFVRLSSNQIMKDDLEIKLKASDDRVFVVVHSSFLYQIEILDLPIEFDELS